MKIRTKFGKMHTGGNILYWGNNKNNWLMLGTRVQCEIYKYVVLDKCLRLYISSIINIPQRGYCYDLYFDRTKINTPDYVSWSIYRGCKGEQ